MNANEITGIQWRYVYDPPFTLTFSSSLLTGVLLLFVIITISQLLTEYTVNATVYGKYY